MSSAPPASPSSPLWKRLLAPVLGAVVLLAVFGLFRPQIAGLWEHVLALLQQLPWPWYFAALVLLPALGCPMSPLLLPMSALFGLGPSILMAFGAIGLGTTLGYHMASGIGRPLLRRILAGTRFAELSLPAQGGWLVLLVMRLTPGVPYCIQNFLPGLCGYPFGRYLLISWPSSFVAISAFIALGDSFQKALKGELGAALAAGGFALLILVFVHWLRSRHAARPTV